MTRLSEEQLAILEDAVSDDFCGCQTCEDDYHELVRGYRDFRAMLREWVAEDGERIGRLIDEEGNDCGPNDQCCQQCGKQGDDEVHAEDCMLAKAEALLAGEGDPS